MGGDEGAQLYKGNSINRGMSLGWGVWNRIAGLDYTVTVYRETGVLGSLVQTAPKTRGIS